MNENDARLKAYMKASGLLKTTEDSKIESSNQTVQNSSGQINLPSNVRLEKNENANPEKDSIYRRVAKLFLIYHLNKLKKSFQKLLRFVVLTQMKQL